MGFIFIMLAVAVGVYMAPVLGPLVVWGVAALVVLGVATWLFDSVMDLLAALSVVLIIGTLWLFK